MKLVMERKGEFECHVNHRTHIENQCGAKGNTWFKYEVFITGSHKSLDQQGFLVDNNEIHQWFDKQYGWGRTEAVEVLPSCERIAMAACDHIKKLVKGCKKVVVRISGNGGDAWLGSEWKSGA